MDAPALSRFRTALRLATVTPREDDPEGLQSLESFLDFVEASFPAFFGAARTWRQGPWGLCACLPATCPPEEVTGLPVLFLSHYDVVPVDASAWTHPPFGADMAPDSSGKDCIWGRGTLDNKNTLMALMEALEELAAPGTRRMRDIWIALGGDEERNGARGAMAMAAWFRKEGLRFSFVHDEGAIVSRGFLKGVDTPLGLIGVAEKGYVNLRLTADQAPGHASRPPRAQAAAELGRALARLESGVFPDRMTPSVAGFLQGLAPLLGGIPGFLSRHPGIFGGLLMKAMGGNPDAAGMFHTTLALTQLEGSGAPNVMPHRVQGVCNLRILPGDTVESALEQVRRRLRGLKVRAEVDPDCLPFGAVADSPRDHEGYRMVASAVAESFPGCAVLPYLVTARTDSAAYADLAGGIYRFSPLSLDSAQAALIHGHDERISLANWKAGMDFYRRLCGAVAGTGPA